MNVEIANVVGSGDLHAELDLEALEEDLSTPYLEYDPSNYHGLYVRVEKDGPLITVYRSGKYIISGCSSYDELNDTNEMFLRRLAELGVINEGADTQFAVQNIVCTASLGEDVDLNVLSIGLGLESVEYEPEQFPGLIYRPSSMDAVLLTFANGKIVVTGSNDWEAANAAFEHLKSKVQKLV
ncbi:TATA binding protein of transcription factor TFIID [Halobiforma haloterrestris]|uniref:TATA-box-binding protein n=1 Tax=Natronobacterium haloterrestre TaxID=148448 RepID=A0A1I1I7H8_NATHA|nr:TATA-box-binding protein [Halobiforma haloterrestris]SFC32379.1 TATA binding protein of transcription factor TFIID [Halobiforma haloterrestris]